MTHILEYLENTAEKFPHKTAVIDESGELDFTELKEQSAAVGTGLIKRLRSPRRPVPVLMEKGRDTVSAFLGAAYAGCFYVPLDIARPAAAIASALETLKPEILVCDREREAVARELLPDGEIVLIDELKKEAPNTELLSEVRAGIISEDPLYVMFTSGSTGVPKGVVISHSAVIAFIEAFTKTFDIGAEDVLGNQAPLDFDVSVKDIYTCLKTGATLVLIPRRLFSTPAALLDFLCEHEVTTMIWAVSALSLVSALHGLSYRVPERVKRVLFSGEVMPEKHLKNWMDALPNAEFVNLYGPTEICCNCCYHVVERARDYGGRLPIGREFPNSRVFLIGADGKEIKNEGEKGEICVSGASLSLGYYGDARLSAEKFVQNPANAGVEERIYKTGDRGFFGEGGELYFDGRLDLQIKYMGHRIELEGIERQIETIDGVSECRCVFDGEKSRLLGFYIGETDETALRLELKKLMPEYMIPGRLKRLPAMPLTKNGKTDRRALLELGRQRRKR